MATQNKKLVYFGKRDEDLWNVIQNVGKGDQNHEIRKALRLYFLGEGAAEFCDGKPSETAAKPVRKTTQQQEQEEEPAVPLSQKGISSLINAD